MLFADWEETKKVGVCARLKIVCCLVRLVAKSSSTKRVKKDEAHTRFKLKMYIVAKQFIKRNH